MNPTDINRRIAELCGWTHIEDHKALMLAVSVWVGYPPAGAMIGRKQPTPNYYESLDCCLEFEQMAGSDVALYEHYLGEITKTDALALRRSFVGERFRLATATPPQRCEAFLRMKGEWVE